jgi:hypothetical protein
MMSLVQWFQTGMGQWSSTQICGKNHTSIQLVLAYHCVKNTTGPLSAWNRQRFLLDSSSHDTDPLLAFDLDLHNQLQEWMQAGEQIIQGVDWNDDI